MKILFSVLKYKLITNESINIGILFHNLDTDQRVFETISKWSRLKSFDDEIDIKYFRIMLDGIKEEIQSNLFTDTVEFYMKEYVKRFYNEMRFSEIYEDYTEDFIEFIEYNKKNFLRYDYEKKDRPNKTEQISYMKRLMKAKEIEYSVKNPLGTHQETIKYDYIVGEYAFKFFSFENKNLDILIHTAKAWAYTAEEMKDRYKTIFVYDVDINTNKFNTIIDILSKPAYKLLKFDDTLDFILDKYNAKKRIF
ncbi:DUF3037 domain-containing protein [Clostridium tertium]|uniref:DUF3037 domain-containing protein n=1 Tax=Clostridium tertium TaxID=1559 RepID=A0A9X3XJG8_9CLOT|nr:DUF3037 domain-containing protein [Clostridium tertium]MDC4240510.1 DUF3037 domain-containing protein [Clostridium tertium]